MWAGFVARFKRADSQFWAYLAMMAVLAWAFLWHLGSPAGLSPTDKAALLASQNHHVFFNSFINDPHNGFLYLLQHFKVSNFFFLRLVSVAFGAIFAWCFYQICRSWFGRFVAVLSTIMFITTPLFLLSARVIEPAIMYLMIAPIIYLYLRLVRSDEPGYLTLMLFSITSAVALYTPGFLWILLFMGIFARRRLSKALGSMPRSQVITAGFVFLVLISPIGWSLALHHNQARSWLWLGPHLSHPLMVLKSLGWSLSSLFWRSSIHHQLQVNRLPILNIAQIVLAGFGFYALWQKARDKAIGFVGLVILAVIGAAVASDYNILIIATLPLMILAAAGLRFLWLEWGSVFPHNPLPRSLAVILICLLAAFSAAYGLRYSLLAWPHTLATRQTYVLK